MPIGALGVGLGLAGLGAAASGYGQYRKDKQISLSEEEEARLRELERMEAINMLGGDYNVALGKQMTPVQGAMREARSQIEQDVSSQDITGGTYFRGQQALAEAGAKERSQAQKQAKEAMEVEEQRQRMQMQMLQARERQAEQALANAFLAAGGGISETAGPLSYAMQQQEKEKTLKDIAGGNVIKGAEAAFKRWIS